MVVFLFDAIDYLFEFFSLENDNIDFVAKKIMKNSTRKLLFVDFVVKNRLIIFSQK